MNIGDKLDPSETDISCVELSTWCWVGLSFGAQHTYGELIQHPKYKCIKLEHELTQKQIARYKKARREMGFKDHIRYEPGDLCEGFDDMDHIVSHAKGVWKTHFPKAKYLVSEDKIIDVREKQC